MLAGTVRRSPIKHTLQFRIHGLFGIPGCTHVTEERVNDLLTYHHGVHALSTSSQCHVRNFNSTLRSPCLDTYASSHFWKVPLAASGQQRGMAKKVKKQKQKSDVSANAGETEDFDAEPYTEKMEQAVEHLLHEMTGIRTGRASPALLESIQVLVYGERKALHHVAMVISRGPRSLGVTVFDREVQQHVLAAISDSPLKLTPRVEGQDIVVPVPEMSPDTQKAMVKLLHQYAENARVTIRGVRKKALMDIKKGGIDSEDMRKRLESGIEDITKSKVAAVDFAMSQKEKEFV